MEEEVRVVRVGLLDIDRSRPPSATNQTNQSIKSNPPPPPPHHHHNHHHPPIPNNAHTPTSPNPIYPYTHIHTHTHTHTHTI
jgi:hypothetical protein